MGCKCQLARSSKSLRLCSQSETLLLVSCQQYCLLPNTNYLFYFALWLWFDAPLYNIAQPLIFSDSFRISKSILRFERNNNFNSICCYPKYSESEQFTSNVYIIYIREKSRQIVNRLNNQNPIAIHKQTSSCLHIK